MKLKPENLKFIIVHQSATKKSETTFEKIKKFHLFQGMGNIAYHYFIEADGRLKRGRNESSQGTHTKAGQMNNRSLGICLAGDFNLETPDPKQLETLQKLLKQLLEKYKLPRNHVLGHREVIGSSTSCPGDTLNDWLEEWRIKEQK